MQGLHGATAVDLLIAYVCYEKREGEGGEDMSAARAYW